MKREEFEWNRLVSAVRFANFKHFGQEDDDGFPYIEHPLRVMQILRQVRADNHVLVAGVLHDTIEDTQTSYEEIEQRFGKKVADLVLELTYEGKKDHYGYYFPRLHSKEAIMIKLADRLDNISRMTSWDKDRQAQYLRKTKFWKDGTDKIKEDEK